MYLFSKPLKLILVYAIYLLGTEIFPPIYDMTALLHFRIQIFIMLVLYQSVPESNTMAYQFNVSH